MGVLILLVLFVGIVVILGKAQKETYSHTKKVNYFIADYCFATEQMNGAYTIQEKILELDDSIVGKDKYKGLSDHVPVIVEIEL